MIQAVVTQAILEGRSNHGPFDPVLAEKVRQAELVGGASASALQIRAAEITATEAELSEVEAAFAGAVFTHMSSLQATALAELGGHWPTIAPVLARLIAIDEVRQQYCGATLKISGLGHDRPWSGSAVVSKLIAGIPARLASAAISQDNLNSLARPMIKSIAGQIEGETQS